MADFLQRFGQKDADGDGYHFSNVRSGLIVGLVSVLESLDDKPLTSSSYLSER
jgi:hypothetical protein